MGLFNIESKYKKKWYSGRSDTHYKKKSNKAAINEFVTGAPHYYPGQTKRLRNVKTKKILASYNAKTKKIKVY